MAQKGKGGDPAGQKYASTFESFVNRTATAQKADVENLETETEKKPRVRRKPKQRAK